MQMNPTPWENNPERREEVSAAEYEEIWATTLATEHETIRSTLSDYELDF